MYSEVCKENTGGSQGLRQTRETDFSVRPAWQESQKMLQGHVPILRGPSPCAAVALETCTSFHGLGVREEEAGSAIVAELNQPHGAAAKTVRKCLKVRKLFVYSSWLPTQAQVHSSLPPFCFSHQTLGIEVRPGKGRGTAGRAGSASKDFAHALWRGETESSSCSHTYIFLVGVEKPECKVARLGRSSIMAKSCGIAGQQVSAMQKAQTNK